MSYRSTEETYFRMFKAGFLLGVTNKDYTEDQVREHFKTWVKMYLSHEPLTEDERTKFYNQQKLEPYH